MNIVFINPYMPIDDKLTILHPPLGFGFLSTALKKKGNNVCLLDLPLILPAERMQVIDDCLRKNEGGIVGFTCVTQTYAIALKLAEYIKEKFPPFYILFGGSHVTFTAKETIERFGFVDYVLTYESEYTIVELTEFLKVKKGSIDEIQGLVYRDTSGKACQTKNRLAETDIDLFGFPDREIFDMKHYLKCDYETVVMTAKGCPNRCAFCSSCLIGQKHRVNSINHVIKELKMVLGMGFRSVFFGDDTFPADRERTIKLCDEIIRQKIRFEWTCNMRVIDVEEELIKKMRSAGMYRTFIGFESFDDKTLKQLGKGSSLEKQIMASKILKKEGVELHASMIVGCASDTIESIKNNVCFLRDIIRPTIATFNTIELRPGTEAYKYPEKYGFFMKNPFWYERTDCVNDIHVSTANLTAAEIRLLCAKSYEWFYE